MFRESRQRVGKDLLKSGVAEGFAEAAVAARAQLVFFRAGMTGIILVLIIKRGTQEVDLSLL